MKLRLTFVSNSSSCSFTTHRDNLTLEQWEAINDPGSYIRKHISMSESVYAEWIMDWEYEVHPDFGLIEYPWAISIDEHGMVHGSTCMDDFDMLSFMIAIGVDMDKVKVGR